MDWDASLLDDCDIEENGVDKDAIGENRQQQTDKVKIPLPSNLSEVQCHRFGILGLWQKELKLREANDALHEIRLALANKAVLFRTDVRHASSHAKTTRAWSKVHSMDTILQRHTSVYRQCRKAIIDLGADELCLNRYRPLKDEDLKVTAAAAGPNSRGHCNDTLAWFWSMDVPRDTEANDWMSECEPRADCRDLADFV